MPEPQKNGTKRFTRAAKAAVGIVFAVAAFVVAIYGDASDRVSYVGVVGVLSLLAGVMFDAPTMERLVDAITHALPWVEHDHENPEDPS